MESPSSSIGIVSRVCTTPVQIPTLANALVGNESSEICIYDLIVAMGNKRNAKSDFRAADLATLLVCKRGAGSWEQGASNGERGA